ncbi:hypothetical protein J7620_10065 [Wohlfahrtiimonas chitiniclastica]|uniref:hypothetical protein n=1 Tax=Wohlfahrtiimonas chitiniclastica TaxID=400946 RepID=UPI001BCC0F61|nr:hypothetical protein [Wohlfahrtiimonas chitiniclastica]MBS7835285.1 hypothetical protein [Wohlfahrtiimonas chitiniclastica]
MPLNIVNQIYNMHDLSIRNVKSVREIANLWLDSPKSIKSNEAIRNLCMNYGISFDSLLNLYQSVLRELSEQSEAVIQKKIVAAPINKEAIDEFYTKLNLRFNEILQGYNFDMKISSDTENNKKIRFTSIPKEFFIDADTGTHYVRDNLDKEFFDKCKYFFNHQINKIMVIFNGERPKVTFEYKEIGDKIVFYCEYNFYFE